MSLLESGFFVIDKPEGITSNDVVLSVRRRLNVRKVGHLGTLDPLATGVLPIALGKATRLIRFLTGSKTYQGTIRLGFSTDTYDRQGTPISEPVNPDVNPDQLNEIANRMLGPQVQVPPPFSAKKIRGVRAYRLARKGVEVQLSSQQICIYQMELTQITTSEVDFQVRCSPGTYVRSIANDLGKQLGCGAHLSRLRRLQSGEFSLDQSIGLQEFLESEPAQLSARVIPLNQILQRLPQVRADKEIENAISHGQNFAVTFEQERIMPDALVRILSLEGDLLGLAEILSEGSQQNNELRKQVCFHPKVVLL